MRSKIFADYRAWLAAEVATREHGREPDACSSGEHAMAARALEELDRLVAMRGEVPLFLTRADAFALLTALALEAERRPPLDPTLETLRARLSAALAEYAHGRGSPTVDPAPPG